MPRVNVQSTKSALYATVALFAFKFSAVISTPPGKYFMVLAAVFTLMSNPSESAIGTTEYPFRTVVWLPMNLSMIINDDK